MGRRIGDKNKPKFTEKPNFNIVEIRLTLDTPFGVQLKPFRKAKKITTNEMAEKLDSHASNVSHFESGDYVTGNSIKTAANYAKALGVKQFKIIL